MDTTRRNMLKIAGVGLAMIPIASLAAKNEPMRGNAKYKDSPEGDKKCSNCAQFIPGKTADALGGCTIFPGDTEVSPNGYCIAWSKKA